MTLKEVHESYSAKYQAYIDEKQSYEDKITESERKIDWHSRRKVRYRELLKNLECPRWTDNMVRPIMAEVAKRTPDIHWEIDERLCTLGLRCVCPIYGDTESGHTVGIRFTPGAKISDMPYYDTGEVENAHLSHSLGDVNGFNNVRKVIESIEELVALVRKQEQEAKNRTDE